MVEEAEEDTVAMAKGRLAVKEQSTAPQTVQMIGKKLPKMKVSGFNILPDKAAFILPRVIQPTINCAKG
jgi:hypothetical protein